MNKNKNGELKFSNIHDAIMCILMITLIFCSFVYITDANRNAQEGIKTLNNTESNCHIGSTFLSFKAIVQCDNKSFICNRINNNCSEYEVKCELIR